MKALCLGKVKQMNQKNKYIKDCKKIFPFYGKKEKAFLDKLTSTIETSTSSNPEVTYDLLVEQFGSPKEIMISYFQNCNDEYVIKQSNIKQTIQKASIYLVTVLIIGISILAYFEYQTVLEFQEREYIVIEETIEEY